jgi:hypothetical protein
VRREASKIQPKPVSLTFRKAPLEIHFRHLSLQSVNKKWIKDMKKDIHPDYKEVVFWDTTSDFKFLTHFLLTDCKDKCLKWISKGAFRNVKETGFGCIFDASRRTPLFRASVDGWTAKITW